MELNKEIEICKEIFNDKLNFDKKNLEIQTVYGKIEFNFPDNYPKNEPQISIDESNLELLNFLKKKSKKYVGKFMIYPLVVDFIEFKEKFKKDHKEIEIIEKSYDIVEDSKKRVSKIEFYQWLDQNKITIKKKQGKTGKQFFLELKKNTTENETLLKHL